jgi:hypothetical protein
VKVWHLIPAEEDGLHDINCACVCEPSLVPEECKGGSDWLQGETAFEHHLFSPIEAEPGSYVGREEQE